MKIEFKNSIGGLIFFVPSNRHPNCLDKSREYLQKLKTLCSTWSENLPMQGNLKQKIPGLLVCT